ncbi:aldo/keto reductase [Cohnella ginsengisoli]|uniref:Aldo/keto reductase n=1 Tax=Cohnella ginsengisoli TaxID=425004 RepID=A0A9X4QN29_9BACL|nr:aldo/keto reductase [Cohnella ginsengisoli]MDG0791525.1 aldo/keto reductase [Cohnella ginsengisoli]
MIIYDCLRFFYVNRRQAYIVVSNKTASRAIDERRGVSISQIALSYIVSRRFPAFAVVGATDESQLADSLGAGDLTLGEEELALLDNGQFSG